jgi:cytidyltransferase-like protein
VSRFKIVAVGGTFDELHKGHKALLRKAFKIGKHVLVGLTSDEFLKSVGKAHLAASYTDRLEKLTAFLRENSLLGRAEIVPLKDACGPAATSDSIEALVVSKETEAMAAFINERRACMKLQPLQLIVVDLVCDEKDLPISTTRIRRGEINREGNLLKTCPK